MKRSGFARAVFLRPPRPPLGRLTRSAIVGLTAMRAPVPKEDAIEHEGYRRLVAALPCANCGIAGYSQAAHPNNDKAKGAKADDRLCFPLCCTRPLIVGCHYLFDQHRLFTREVETARAQVWGRMTRLEIVEAGDWPANLPRWIE